MRRRRCSGAEYSAVRVVSTPAGFAWRYCTPLPCRERQWYGTRARQKKRENVDPAFYFLQFPSRRAGEGGEQEKRIRTRNEEENRKMLRMFAENTLILLA